MKSISIIIPFYNAQDYVDRTFLSLINQTIGISNLEIICVDDASTDNTFEEILKWEEKYPDSIIAVHLDENGRQGRARNIGISYASSEYIGFMDDDDIISPDMFHMLYEAAKVNNVDVSCCSFRECKIEEYYSLKDSLMYSTNIGKTYQILNNPDRVKLLDFFNTAIWNKIYRKDLILSNNIRFPEGMIYDDIYFSGLLVHYVSSIHMSDNEMYFHIIGESNASSQSDPSMTLGYYESVINLYSSLTERGLYAKFKDYYDKRLSFEYMRFIYFWFIKYGKISNRLWDSIKEKTLCINSELYKSINPKEIFIDSKSTDVNQIIWDSLSGEITEEYYYNVIDIIDASLNSDTSKE